MRLIHMPEADGSLSGVQGQAGLHGTFQEEPGLYSKTVS